MSTPAPPPAQSYRTYPAYCFPSSATYNAWVKLTAADVQALRSEPEFQSQSIYFHLNHPIRYIRLVGAIVAIENINLKYTVLTLDDGSGATIEVKIIRLTPSELSTSSSHPSNTKIPNVNVYSRLGNFRVVIDGAEIDIGTVLKVKCTISEFRGSKQLEMLRAWVVRTTDEEAAAWAETAEYKREVLSRAWRVSGREHRRIKEGIERERKAERAERVREKKVERMRAEKEAERMNKRKVRAEKLARHVEELERKDRRESSMMNAGALI